MRTAKEWADELEGKLAGIQAAFRDGDYEAMPGLVEGIAPLIEEANQLEGSDGREADLLLGIYDLALEAQQWPEIYKLRQRIEDYERGREDGLRINEVRANNEQK